MKIDKVLDLFLEMKSIFKKRKQNANIPFEEDVITMYNYQQTATDDESGLEEGQIIEEKFLISLLIFVQIRNKI